MKIFLFALVLFALLLGFITFNYIYVNRAASELSSMAYEISASTDDVEALSSAWETKKAIVGLSSGMSKIDSIYDLLDTLYVCAEIGDTAEFERTRALTVNAFEDLAEFESFSIEDIF